MKTLLTLFSKERNELETELDKATSVEQVVQLVQNRLDNLERNYVGELSVAKVRLASFFLDTLRQSVATLIAANEARISVPDTQQTTNQAKRFSPKTSILKVLQALICLGVFGSLFSLTQTTLEAWMPILLMSSLVGLEAALNLDKDNQANTSDSPQLVEASQPVVQIDSKVLLDNLADALNIIDQAVAPVADGNKSLDKSEIEESPELLNLLQRLMGASFLERPQMALELTKLLPQTLMEQGIQPQLYLPGDAHSRRDYFDFEPSIDRSAKDCVTITPALVKGDRLLRRGRVIEPAYSKE